MSIWHRLPRGAYWVTGAAIAFVGAIVAKSLSDQVPLADRWIYWLGGSAMIFVGLYVLSLGTKSRLRKRGAPPTRDAS